MENNDSYILCGIILGITFIVILIIISFVTFNSPEELEESEYKNLTTTHSKVIKSTTKKEENISMNIKAIQTILPNKEININTDSDNEEEYHIATYGYSTITLKTNENTNNWILPEEEEKCIELTKNPDSSLTVHSNSCYEEKQIVLALETDNINKKITIINEPTLKIQVNGEEKIGDSTLTSSLIELTSNQEVNWSVSNENSLTYTEIDNINLNFKLFNKVTIKAHTNGGQIKEISLMPQ